MQQPDLDVVIVGGRVAGGTLAARLGARGLRVLVDRAMPTLPQVPSS
jgi:choline dehydrogenase-like flavoprotein